MDQLQEIRRKAATLRREVCEANGLDDSSLIDAKDLTSLTLDNLGLSPSPEFVESANLHGSLAVLEEDVVFFRNDLEGGFRQFCIAHEAGHFVLHRFAKACSSDDIGDNPDDDAIPTAKARVIGYGPHERAEREANLFALELLLPCAALRKAFIDDGLDAPAIAERTGMLLSQVTRQLARAVLLPETGDGGPSGTLQFAGPEEAERFELDPSQKAAAETDVCPVLISAGPGTGKTATLIGRIVHLLDKGANPSRILALTFSNKATQEMRERISEARPADAAQIQIMTFHSFGFNLLMRYWGEAKIDADARLLDQIDALLMLEEHLADLKLEHYLALYDPMRDLPDVLTAISVAKDELCGPAEYKKHAEQMGAAAEDDAEILKAEKAMETAGVYEQYQRLMDEKGLLDFGDLIYRPVELLRSNEAVRNEVRGLYDHVLVDEFQDVNRASGVLLRLVAGKGKGLWAVGDLRQSIYRWRGASPENIKLFHEEYPGSKTLSLETNYRSVEPVVRTFGEFGKGMIAREPFNEWRAFRGKGSGEAVTLDVADRFETEASAIADRVLEDRALGAEFKDQAVICRTHGQLAAVSNDLTAKGIPVFYLGQLFERPEIRDLLSLLELASANNAHALLRVGEFDEYGLSISDLFSILTIAEDRQTGLGGIEADDEALNLGEPAREGLRKLKDHMRRDPRTSAYILISDYLFSRSSYLRSLLSGSSVSDKQKLIAIYQLVGFAASLEGRFADSIEPVAEFLRYIKRLVLFREQKNLAEIPAAASGLDAVRLLTVHGAKGLEFGSVFLPYLAAGKMPGRYRSQKCPTPPGVRRDPKEDHLEEEECLFFVALSRARDHLHLSRSVNYSERVQSKESPFLAQIENVLPGARAIASPAEAPAEEALPPEEYTRREFYAAELDRYLDCARQYFYRYEAGLKTGDNRTAYQKLHGIVFETLREVQDSDKGGSEMEAFARETLEKLWEEADLDGHPYASLYREKAEQLLERVIERFGNTEGSTSRKTIRVPLSNGGVKVSADSIEEIGSGNARRVVARNVKTGKQPKTVETKNADAVLLKALEIEYPDAEVSVSKVFLSDDSEYTHDISQKVIANRMAKYEEAIDGINRGEFDPDPSDFKCPTCAYYFMCSSKKSGVRSRES